MEKQTKVKITLYVIPIIVIALIAAVVVLVITIRSMQKEEGSVEKLSAENAHESSNSLSFNNTTSNVTNTSNTSNTVKNETDDDDDENENTTSKKTDKDSSSKINKKKKAEQNAKEALDTALSSITTDFFANKIEDASILSEALTAERLEEIVGGKYIFEVNWNGALTRAQVRMQLADDEESPVYSADVNQNLQTEEFETEED